MNPKISNTVFAAILVACSIFAPAQTPNNARMLSGVNYRVSTTYTFVAADATRIVSFSNGASIAATLPAGGTTGFGAGTVFSVSDRGAGTLTITCSGCTINGAPTLVLATGQSADIYSDGTNYVAATGVGGGGGGGSLPTASAAGQYPNSTGPGTTYTAQSKLAIDARDIGVDCTGAADSSTVLNAFNVTQKELDFPYGCQVRLNSTWNIFGAGAFLIRGLGERPNQGVGGPQIFGCGTSGANLIYINRSQYGHIEGLGLYAKGSGCTSTFTQPLVIDNNGAGGLNGHDFEIARNAIATSPSGGTISGFIAFQVANGSAQNLESINIHDNWIHCQNSANSIGIDIEAGTSDSDEARFNNINSCKFGIESKGNIRIVNNLFSSVAANSVFGTFGAAIYTPGCSSGPMTIAYNEMDSSGPFLDNDHTGVSSCPNAFNLIGNVMGVSDIASGEFVIDVGGAGGWNLIGNSALVTVNTNQYIIGSQAQPALKGPLGNLNEIGNSIPATTSSHVLGWEDLTRPFQGGESRGFSTVGSTVPIQNNSQTNISTTNFLLMPPLNGNTFRQQSAFLGLRSWTGSAADDWIEQSMSDSSNSALIFNHNSGAAPTFWFNWDGNISGLNLAQLGTPGPPTGVTPVGVSGGTTYTYAIVAFGQTGNTPGSTTLSTNLGNATLSGSNYNLIQWVPTASIGANKWCIWRTAGAATQGKIGCVPAVATSANGQNADTYYFNDTGLAGDASSLPASNTTGQIASTVPTGLAPLSVQSTTPVANLTTVPVTYNHSGTQQTGVHIVEDVCTLGTNCSVTLTGAAVFTNSTSYQCTAIDQTGANAVKFLPSSGSAFALTGTGTDVLSYVCVGN
jgi:hypothetical protein